MNVSDLFRHQYIQRLKEYLPQEIILSPTFQTAIETSLNGLAELSTPRVCEARKAGLALSCESHDLAERMLKLADGSEFVAGARYKNLDTSFPFVEIHYGLDLTAFRLKEICEIVESEFASLHPMGLKFKDKPGSHQNLEKWSHTVFGKIENRRNLFLPEGLHVSFTQKLDWFSQYVHEYQERLAEKNELAGFVRIGQLDEFQESVEAKALLLATDSDGFCGVFAGVESPLYGLPAIYMIESYLSKRWTGKRIAPLVHAIFLNEMSRRFDYVWGTIYDKNLSSLNTALSVGRRIIETEYFTPFNEQPRTVLPERSERS